MLPNLTEIRKIRKRLDLTQKDLARISGISQSAIAKIEKGRMVPSYEIAKRIFNALEKEEQKADKEMDVGRIIVTDLITLEINDRIKRARELMERYGISQIPVLDKGKVVGTVTERSILSLLDGKKGNIDELSVRYAMIETLPQLPRSTPIKTVREILKTQPAVLIMEKGEILGIITRADLVYNL